MKDNILDMFASLICAIQVADVQKVLSFIITIIIAIYWLVVIFIKVFKAFKNDGRIDDKELNDIQNDVNELGDVIGTTVKEDKDEQDRR